MKIAEDNQRGFTILELMIATVIVSIILVMVSSVMIGLQATYNKGISQEKVQDNARTIVDEVAQEIQSSTGVVLGATNVPPDGYPTGYSKAVVQNSHAVTLTVNAYCIGTVRYLYVTGGRVGSDVSQGLWRDTAPEGNSCYTSIYPLTCLTPNLDIITQTPASCDNGQELISAGERLTDFEIIPPTPTDPNYIIKVSIANGSDDLLTYPIASYSTKCIGGTNDQFCATASLTTEVGQRDNESIQAL